MQISHFYTLLHIEQQKKDIFNGKAVITEHSFCLSHRFDLVIKEVVAKRWQSVTLVKASDVQQTEAPLVWDLFPARLSLYLAHMKDVANDLLSTNS